MIASIEGIEDRLMDRLSKQLKTTVMAINTPQDSSRFRGREQQERNKDREPRDHYQGTNKQNSPKTSAHDTVTIIVITTVITTATNAVQGTRYQNDQYKILIS